MASVGEIAVSAEAIDITLLDALAALLPGDDPAHKMWVAGIAYADRTLSEKTVLVREIAREALCQDSFSKLCRILGRVDNARSIRNKRVHAVWIAISDTEVEMSSRITSPEEIGAAGKLFMEPETVTAEQLQREAEQVTKTALDLHKFLEQHSMMLTASPDISA